MKKLMLNFILLLTPFMMMAQNTAVDKLMKKYSEKDGYVSVTITKHMFSLFAGIDIDIDIDVDIEDEGGEAEDLIKVFQALDGIKILSTELHEEGVNFYEEIMKELPVDDYEELMVVHEKGQDTKFLIKKKNEKIKELLMIVGGNKTNALVSITGDIDLKRISKLSHSLGIESLENMEKIKEKYY
ncbi:DUF4252 domain-containing protein [Bacteroidota bacterium]